MRPATVSTLNGKGGTGKTSTTTNIAGQAAAAGYRVLVVDLDPQGNVSQDLGFHDVADRDDKGEALFEALHMRRELRVLTDVRPNLDVVVGGPHLDGVSALAQTWARQGRTPQLALAEALAPIVGRYHLTLIDCPPGDAVLQELALCAAGYALIPTRSDEASLQGLTRVARTFTNVRQFNPGLQLLGVVLFGITASGTAMERDVRAEIERGLGGVAPVFATKIPYLEAPAVAARNRGLLVHEYERDMVRNQPKFWEKLRDPGAGKHTPTLPADRLGGTGTANKLAIAYAQLTSEVLAAVFADEALAVAR